MMPYLCKCKWLSLWHDSICSVDLKSVNHHTEKGGEREHRSKVKGV